MVEKDRLLQQLDACHHQLQLDRQPTTSVIDVSKLHDDLLSAPLAHQDEFKVDLRGICQGSRGVFGPNGCMIVKDVTFKFFA